MIFESLINPKKLNSNMSAFFLLGLIYTSVAIFLSLVVFSSEVSMVMIFFIVMAIIPYVYNSIKHEETEDMTLNDEKSILKEHAKTLTKFMLLFLGMVVAFVIWYLILPNEISSKVFSVQLQTINSINSGGSTNSGNVVGYLSSKSDYFFGIMFNNLVVLFFCLIFSFLFGFGAIFILTWNASVIGAAIGVLIKSGIDAARHLAAVDKAGAYFSAGFCGLFRYSIHGIPEILAYFVAGLAGGIISVAAIKHDFRSKKYHKIIVDSADLIIISIIIIVISAFIEVYVTPGAYNMVCS